MTGPIGAAEVERVVLEHLQGEYGDSAGVEIDASTHLLEEEVLDSLGIFALVDFVEERFGCEIPPEEIVLENFERVGTIAALVDRILAG